MNKTLLAAVAAAAFCGAPAFAADMPVPPTAAAPIFSWTGFYVGANGGYGWHDPTVTFTGGDELATLFTCLHFGIGTCPPPVSFNIRGGLGGLQAGYNRQLNRNVVLGVETDFDWSRIRGMGTSNFFNLFLSQGNNFIASEKVDWFGTVRGRLGFLLTDRLLAYGTGGFAYGGVKQNVVLNTPANFVRVDPQFAFACNASVSTECFSGSSSRTAAGWTAGGGLEYAAWNNVSLRAEYLYINLGKNTVNAVDVFRVPGVTPSSFNAAFSQTDFHLFRIAVNYLFSTR